MKSKLLKVLVATGLVFSSVLASAQQESESNNPAAAAIQKSLEKSFDSKITAVRTTPYSGLYEVQIGSNLVYTDAKASYIIAGNLIDAKTRQDITSERMDKLSAVAFNSLPLDLAVKQVKGNGKRQMAIFEDPNCGYCHRLHEDLKSVDNVTIYTFLYPILSPDSLVKSRNVWCAKDQAKTWANWMDKQITPPTADCSNTPIAKIMALGQKLVVQGTPAIIFGSDKRVNGYIPSNEIEKNLNENKKG